jgi:uncharacterized linocin/CFP29 family protein
MFRDYVLNGQGFGPVGQMLSQIRFDPGFLRPYLDDRNRTCITINTGRLDQNGVQVYENVRVRDLPEDLARLTTNAASLRKDEWIQIDRNVVKAARKRLRAWDDLYKNSSVGGFNGMSKLTYEYEASTDPGVAVQDMSGLTPGRNDTPQYILSSIPLPITHADFMLDARRLAASRNSGTPLDATIGNAGARRVAELVEQQTIGTKTGITFGTNSAIHRGTSKVYGYTNFPYRTTKTDLTTPTGSNPEAVLSDILEMRATLQAQGFYGPYMVYHSAEYDVFLDNDYARLGGINASMTLRDRLRKTEDVMDVRRLDYLSGSFRMIMVQMDPDVAQAINAMDIMTVQWPEKGGMQQNFKIMCIWAPLLKARYDDTAGIVDATTS